MTGFVLFGLILLVLLSTIIRAAIRAGEDTGAPLAAPERRNAAIEALRDLELEYRTGKLSDEEYRTVRRRLEREAIAARDDAAGSGLRDAGGEGTPPPPECPDCTAPLGGDEAFCPACGTALAGPSRRG